MAKKIKTNNNIHVSQTERKAKKNNITDLTRKDRNDGKNRCETGKIDIECEVGLSLFMLCCLLFCRSLNLPNKVCFLAEISLVINASHFQFLHLKTKTNPVKSFGKTLANGDVDRLDQKGGIESPFSHRYDKNIHYNYVILGRKI